jgi:hypothetical protein
MILGFMPAVLSTTRGFVPQYYHDLFISYAHGDEAAPMRWVSRFKDVLTNELGGRLGRPPVIWFDTDRLRPGFQLDEKIRYDLGRTAVLLRMISPFYNNSGYCALEREWFENPASPLDSLVVESQSRSIICVLRPDPEGGPEISEIYAVFHDAEGRPFDPEEKVIQPVVTRLAAAIADLLRRMAASRPLVYVPYAGADVEPTRERLIGELHADGYRTIPRSNEPFQRAKTLEDLNRSPLSVFLLGRTFMSELKSRLAIARELAKGVIIWIDPDCDMDPEQVECADSLIADPPGELLRQRSAQDLLQTVRDRLRDGFQVTFAERVESLRTHDTARKILLICKSEERGDAEHVRLHVEGAGFKVLLPDVTTTSRLAAHRVASLANFSQASGVLVFAKSRAPIWFDQQLRKLSQPVIGTRLAQAIALLDPPPKPDMIESAKGVGFKEGYAARLLVVASDQIAVQQLEPFLNLLRADGSNS